jgi:5-formyltetrahydrofolate cyclo-ligase
VSTSATPAPDGSTPPAPEPNEQAHDPAAVRSAARAARRSLTDRVRRAAHADIAARLLDLDELQHATHVGWYVATDGEVDPSDAVDALRGRGSRLWLPIVGAERSMRFAPWQAGSSLRPNRYGIDEPEHDPADAIDAAGLDVVLVPCVAVDDRGHRLGFGAGYYDRALQHAAAVRVGVVFEVQVVDRIVAAPWDVPLDVVVTEARCIRPDADDPGRR